MLYSLKECRNKLLAYVNKRMITYVPHTNIIGEQVYSNEKKNGPEYCSKQSEVCT